MNFNHCPNLAIGRLCSPHSLLRHKFHSEFCRKNIRYPVSSVENGNSPDSLDQAKRAFQLYNGVRCDWFELTGQIQNIMKCLRIFSAKEILSIFTSGNQIDVNNIIFCHPNKCMRTPVTETGQGTDINAIGMDLLEWISRTEVMSYFRHIFT